MAEEIYSDINTIKPKGNRVVNEQAVIQELYNFCTTKERERRYRFELGFSPDNYVFDFPDFVGEFQIKTDLINKLNTQTSRLEPNFAQSTINASPDDESYRLRLVTIIKGFGNRTFQFLGSIFK